jgi:hypothetical protein
MMTATLPDLTGRHQLFEAARCSAHWTVNELWMSYLALGGQLLVVDLQGYLNGLTPLPPGQQDVLACALNERLADLSDEVRVPYLTVLSDRCEQALSVLEGGDGRHNDDQDQDHGLGPATPTTQRPRGRTGSGNHCGSGQELIFEKF